MNSEERRAARRKRREEKRAAKRAERVRNCTLERIADPNALYIAAKQCGRNVKWKASIQTYLVHILRNITKARADILNGVDFCRPTNDFVIYEQGVRREISAVKIYERVIKKSYCQNALVPAVVPHPHREQLRQREGARHPLRHPTREAPHGQALPKARNRRLHPAR